MHPFPPLVYTEGVRWTQETKGRKSDNMADYKVQQQVGGKLELGSWKLEVGPSPSLHLCSLNDRQPTEGSNVCRIAWV